MKSIPLSQGYWTAVDDEDYDRLAQFDWHANVVEGKPYARRSDGVYMHRFVISAPSGVLVDHKFGDTLDNRKSNLRQCDSKQNCRGFKRKKSGVSSLFIGVNWYKRYQCWRAYIVRDNRQTHLGYFKEEKFAAVAYNDAARKMFGEYAVQNSIPL